MFLKKLDITKNEQSILAIATGALIIGILVVISLMSTGIKDKNTDLDFLGYRFTALAKEVIIMIPGDDQTSVEITDESYHHLENLSETINKSYMKFQSILRNSLIFIYLAVFFIIVYKKRATHFQGVFKGILLGAGLMLLFFTVQGVLDLNSMLVSFEHDFTHLIF